MKVSFDFDSTLALPIIQKLAERHISFGDEVHITTTRHPTHLDDYDSKHLLARHRTGLNIDLFRISDRLGIDRDNIHFTKSYDKVHFLKSFDIHYDDDEHEIDLITRSDLICTGILINYKNYYLDSE